MKSIYFIAALAVLATSCGNADKKQDTPQGVVQAQYPRSQKVYDTIEIKRLDLLATDFNTLPRLEAQEKLNSMEPGASIYLNLMSKLIASNGKEINPMDGMSALAKTSAVNMFGRDVKGRLGNLTQVEAQIGQVCGALAENFPKARVNQVYAVISPYRQGVITSDSTVLIVTNLYLGKDYEGYNGFDEYFRSTREVNRIPYDVAEAALAAGYPYTDGKTVLSKMLYHGALAYCVMSTMRTPSPALAIGVTTDQLEWLKKNRTEIWRTLIDRNMLYSTTPLDADKLLAEAGSSPWLHAEAPGRVGRFIGLEIVRAYLAQKPETEVSWLLTPAFYNSETVLTEAAFNPQ